MKKIVIAVLFAALCIIQSCEETLVDYYSSLSFHIVNKTDDVISVLSDHEEIIVVKPTETETIYIESSSGGALSSQKEAKDYFASWAQYLLRNIKECTTIEVSGKVLNETVFTQEYWELSFSEESYYIASYTLTLDEDMIKKIGYAE